MFGEHQTSPQGGGPAANVGLLSARKSRSLYPGRSPAEGGLTMPAVALIP
jgi:hypothetical protein